MKKKVEVRIGNGFGAEVIDKYDDDNRALIAFLREYAHRVIEYGQPTSISRQNDDLRKAGHDRINVEWKLRNDVKAYIDYVEI